MRNTISKYNHIYLRLYLKYVSCYNFAENQICIVSSFNKGCQTIQSQFYNMSKNIDNNFKYLTVCNKAKLQLFKSRKQLIIIKNKIPLRITST